MLDETQSRTSPTLLERVRRKDQEAWEQLIRLYGPLVCHWCLRGGLQPADAEEVCQEVFLAVARAIGEFRHDREGDTFRGWLRVITRNRIRDRAPPAGGAGEGGSEAHERLVQLPAPSPEEADAEVNDVYRRAVELVECAFEPPTRRAFWLLISGRRAADVADELHMSVGAVHAAKSRVLKRLREEFAGLLDGPADKTEGI